MFDPKAAMERNEKARAQRQIVEWARDGLPGVVREALGTDPVHVQMNVREVLCGDPTCSPIDTVLMFIFKNGRQATTGLPLEMVQVVKGDVDRAMLELRDELVASHEDRDLGPQGLAPLPLTTAGEEALERILAVLRRELVALAPADIAGVCSAAMDMLEQIEEDAARPPAARMVQQAGQRGAMDPNARILSASQKNDVDAVKQYVERDGVSPSYANSLGQTPLHIAAMWGNVATVDYLVKAGADVGAVNQLSNATPLHVAASSNKDHQGRLNCARLLLAAGADPRAPDADGCAPWQKCLDNPPLKDLLQQAAAAADASAA